MNYQSVQKFCKTFGYRLVQWRTGFNCNSSSTSVIFYSDTDDGSECYDGQYLRTPDEKRQFIRGMIMDFFGDETPESTKTAFCELLYPNLETIETSEDPPYLPASYDGGISVRFIRWFDNLVSDPKFAIYDGERGYFEGDPADEFLFMDNSYGSVIKFSGDDLILFDRGHGTLAWITKSDDPKRRSLTPNLVDLKITDYCPYDCKFCYQGSTTKGKHANFWVNGIYDVLEQLSNWETFEVAIGGGEPTLHPEFLKILYRANDLHIVPSFTTRNLKFIQDHLTELTGNKKGDGEHAKDYYDYKVGSIGISTEKIETIHELTNIVIQKRDFYLDPNFFHIHLIPSLINKQDFRQMVSTALKSGFAVTLLGYKTSGRGGETILKAEYDVHEVIKDVIGDYGSYRVNKPLVLADTCFVQQYPEYFDNDHKALWSIQEGQSSMYIDAVNKTFAKHSFGAKNYPYEYPTDILPIYQANFPE